MKYYKLILIALVLYSCDVSKLSESKTVNLAKIKAIIDIQDYDTNKTRSSIKVKLSDGKKQIINKKIKVLLNDIPLRLYVKKDLYYTQKSFYTTDSLARKESYYFEIILPDHTRHPLAFIKPNSIHCNTTFSFPEASSIQEDILIKWKKLNTAHFVTVTKGVQLNKNPSDKNTYHEYEKRNIDTLKETTGNYVIPKSFLMDSLSTTNFINIDISRQEMGLLNPNLMRNSSVHYQYQINKTITVLQK